MTAPENDRQPRAGIARWYGYVASFISFGKSAVAWSLTSSISTLLDQILLILLLVELLYTVQVSFREHALVPEPFLLRRGVSGRARSLTA